MKYPMKAEIVQTPLDVKVIYSSVPCSRVSGSVIFPADDAGADASHLETLALDLAPATRRQVTSRSTELVYVNYSAHHPGVAFGRRTADVAL
jgi:hypothetical protein